MLTYSRYNHCVRIPDEDAFALVNFRTGAVMRLTPFQKAIFDRATELSGKAGFVQKLQEAGVLVDYDERRHMRTQAFSESGRSQNLSLTICPTLACNFACPYCFEEARSGRMSGEMEELVVEFAKYNMEFFGLKRLGITWFGGEPLLCPDSIERLSERFIKLCAELGADYHAGIITNGWFLTEENIRLLERSGVTFMQITLDGPTPETNDPSRREKGGGSSFTRIMENIRKLRPYDIQPKHHGAIVSAEAAHLSGENSFASLPPAPAPAHSCASAESLPKVSIRCNINRENAPLFEELRDKIDAIAAETGVNLSVYASRMDIAKSAAPELLQKEMDMSEYAGSQAPEDLLKRWGTPFCRRVYCMAQRLHDYCIDELGNLYKCWEDVGKDGYSFGNIKDFSYAREPGGRIGAMDAYYETLFPEYDKECMECKFFPLCLGGCPHRRIMNRRECIVWKNNPDGYALTRYHIWKKQKDTK